MTTLTCDQLDALTDGQHACIVPDIADATLVDNTTPSQEAALIAALCGAFVKVKIFESDGIALIAEKDSGETFNIPKHNILRPDGITVVQADEHNENYTTDPSIFDCQELNDNLTQGQRDLLQRSIPGKTGQTPTSPLVAPTGSDGDLELGRGVDFFTLGCDNEFGNTDRFTDFIGGQNYDAVDGSILDVLRDHSTDLDWTIVSEAGDNWTDHLAFAIASNFGGLSGWFMPNTNQICSLWNFVENAALDYAPFNIGIGDVPGNRLWLSTTDPTSSGRAFSLRTDTSHALNRRTKTENNGMIMCRNHS